MSSTRTLLVYTTSGQLCILPDWSYGEEEAATLKRTFREAFGLSEHYQVDQTIVRPNEPYRLSIPLPAGPDGQLFGPEAAKRHLATRLSTFPATVELM